MFKLIISFFLIAGAFVIFFTESKNYFPEIKNLRNQASSYNETINTAKKVRSSIDKTLGDYNAISQENVDRINKMVPSSAEPMKLVVQFDEMMRKNGLVLKNIDTRDIVTKNSAPVSKNKGVVPELIALSIKTQGSYDSFYSFIRDLEKSLRLIDVNSVKITPAGQDSYDFSVEAVSYWRKISEKI